jgi:predicted nucleic acid-binding protein
MNFPDTSFLCSVYREQSHSSKADAWMAKNTQPLPVSSLLILEFRQSIRLQNWLFQKDRTRGFSIHEGEQMLRDIQTDLTSGLLQMTAPDWAEVHRIAEDLSSKHTLTEGNRLADILHLATAKYLGTETFLSFDDKQRSLARAEGMTLGV